MNISEAIKEAENRPRTKTIRRSRQETALISAYAVWSPSESFLYKLNYIHGLGKRYVEIKNKLSDSPENQVELSGLLAKINMECKLLLADAKLLNHILHIIPNEMESTIPETVRDTIMMYNSVCVRDTLVGKKMMFQEIVKLIKLTQPK